MSDSPFFLDTNIFIYAYSLQDTTKKIQATKLIISGEVMISVQIINEFCNIIKKKFAEHFESIEIILQEIQAYMPIVTLDHNTTLQAVQIAKRYQLSFYDSLVLASALERHCRAVLTEDLQHGLQIENKWVVLNPFKL